MKRVPKSNNKKDDDARDDTYVNPDEIKSPSKKSKISKA